MAIVYNNRPATEGVSLTNSTGAALAQFELTVMGGLVLMANEAIANGAVGGFEDVEGQTCQISDFVATEDTFGTVNAAVYFDPATGDFSDTSDATYYPIGIVKTIKNSGGVIEVLLQRHTAVVGA